MIDLKKLEKKLDDALEAETKESLTEWLTNKRKSNTMEKMIQPNELRIGNVLMYMTDEGPMRQKIDAQDILFCEDVNVAFNEVHKPIPLTPELLLELGAEEIKKTSSREFYLHNRLIMFDENGAFDYVERTRLPYLHTLQNFIYAVKGEELTLNTK